MKVWDDISSRVIDIIPPRTLANLAVTVRLAVSVAFRRFNSAAVKGFIAGPRIRRFANAFHGVK